MPASLHYRFYYVHTSGKIAYIECRRKPSRHTLPAREGFFRGFLYGRKEPVKVGLEALAQLQYIGKVRVVP